ncbi:MAG: Nif3-like dinuclear metal center hexameric protein [Proteobacteria bacterium]|nr:Nif3-like dinuclear metal center hexameric protein [Pseudomonadota bacterium]
MTVRDIQQFLEDWAPAWTAWERDNVGLQIGDPEQPAHHVLVALDVTPEVVREAVTKKAQVILSHHPLLFRPPKTVRTDEPLGSMVHALARHRISVVSAHTNLDFAKGGVSFALASRLGLINVRFLNHLKNHLAKLVVFVPESHVEQITSAMAHAGAGVIGEYTDCSFRTMGTGTYRGSQHARPYLGKPLKLEHVPEVRLEMILPRALSGRVIAG